MRKVWKLGPARLCCGYIHDIEYARRRNRPGNPGNPYVERPLHLELLRPAPEQGEKLPSLLMVPGGGFREPKVKFRLPWLSPLAERGVLVAFVEYRGMEAAPLVGMVEDIRDAVRYLHNHGAVYGGDPDKIVLMGASAGGYLALQAAYSLPQVKGVIDLYGVVDFPTMAPSPDRETELRASVPARLTEETELSAILKKMEENSVLHAVEAGGQLPPTLIAHGTADTIVSPEQSEMLYRALCKGGYQADLHLIKDAWHADLHFFQKEMINLYEEFLRTVTQS